MAAHIAITGGNSGIGAALARLHARRGDAIAAIARDRSRLDAIAEECRSLGAASVETASIDVTDRAAIQRGLREIDRARPIDRIYVNAGGSAPEGPDRALRITELNVLGALASAEAALGEMRERGRGEIALISSLASFSPLRTAPAYCAAKAWLRFWGEAIRPDAAKDGVTVSVVCPGFVDTPLVRGNPWPMPMIMSADDAAAIIARGVDRNKARIAFPWPMALAARFLGALPPDWAARLIAGRPAKE